VADTFLEIVRAAASHPLLGDDSLIDRAATGGSTSSLIDSGLAAFTNDRRYENRWVYIWAAAGAAAGNERRVYSSQPWTGTLVVNPVFGAAAASGDQYLLFRDFRFSDWLRFANETARSLYYDREVYLRGQTNVLRYTLPVPLSQPGWIEGAWVGEHPFAFSTDFDLPRKIDWYRLDPLNIVGDTYLLLTAALSASDQIVFKARVPYLHPHLSAYTMTRSVLVPFGESDAVTVPRNVLVAGMVWRALQQKARHLTGAAREVWERNLDTAARTYAEQLRGMGVWAAGREVGYATRW
jgi:hypothetical protein